MDFGALDPQQLAVVTAPAGPVCVLAGAGTGKTRSITHRIAHRCLIGEVFPSQVLAVTFTTRAANQMRDQLSRLGVPGVQVRTFHAAALRQVRHFAPRLFDGHDLPSLVESKTRLVAVAASNAGIHPDQATTRDLASEIEWAKASLVEPPEYEVAAAKAGRDGPLDAPTVSAIYLAYERLKRGRGLIDFEDLLRTAVWAIEEHPDVADQVRARYRCFVVDEYQDVNPVQQRLLDAWLGGRDDVTVVGDASQTIYSFTGASSVYLVDFAARYPGATTVRLVRDYRSTPQVVAWANAVIAQSSGELAGLRLDLIGQRPQGPTPETREFPDEPAEAGAVAARCADLMAGGTSASQIAVLFRTNAQSQRYEEALAEAGIPYVVHGGERFFERPEIRRAMVALRAATRTVPPSVSARQAAVLALEAVGWRPDAPPGGGVSRERWEAINALVGIADELGEEGTLDDLCSELARRAATQHEPDVGGVVLSSLHAAKGLEWDAVFLVGLAEGTLPISHARTPEALEEERRLLYVGITRARTWLWLSHGAARYQGGRERRPSRFLRQLPSPSGVAPAGGVMAASGYGQAAGDRTPPGRERGGGGGSPGRVSRGTTVLSCRVCGEVLTSAVDRKLGRCSTCPSTRDEDLFQRLMCWRARVAQKAKVPSYVVFTDATLMALAEQRPSRIEEMAGIGGIGAGKLTRYGADVLALVAGTAVEDLVGCAEK